MESILDTLHDSTMCARAFMLIGSVALAMLVGEGIQVFCPPTQVQLGLIIPKGAGRKASPAAKSKAKAAVPKRGKSPAAKKKPTKSPAAVKRASKVKKAPAAAAKAKTPVKKGRSKSPAVTRSSRKKTPARKK